MPTMTPGERAWLWLDDAGCILVDQRLQLLALASRQGPLAG